METKEKILQETMNVWSAEEADYIISKIKKDWHDFPNSEKYILKKLSEIFKEKSK